MSYKNASSANLAALPQITASNWYGTAEGWLDRSGDLRDAFQDAASPLGYVEQSLPVSDAFKSFEPKAPPRRLTGVWGHVSGGAATRTGSIVSMAGGFPVTVDTGFSQTMSGLEAGVDYAIPQGNSTFVAGAMAAYGSSSVNFASGDRAQAIGPSIGGYLDWIGGTAYVDALVKADFLTVNYNIASTSGAVSGRAVGGAVEAGDKIELAPSLYVEPVADVAYVNTVIDPARIGVDTVNFSGDSLRAKAGGRLGATFVEANTSINPYLSAFGGNEFLGSGAVSFSVDGSSSSGEFTGAFGEFGIGVNLKQPVNGFSAFAEGAYTVANGYSAGTLKGGIRGGF